jgi:hypothetical protein
MKMKVGDILKEEIKDIPGLQYPFKVIINSNFRYSENEKIENTLFIEKCNAFINFMEASQKFKSFHKSKSLSKTVFTKHPFKKGLFIDKLSPLRKNSDKLPIIKNQISLDLKRVLSKLNFNNSDKNFNKKSDNNVSRSCKDINNLSVYKRGLTPYFRTTKTKKKVSDPFMVDLNENILMKRRFKLSYDRKFKIINRIIDKLNKPIFINSNKENINCNQNKCFI